MTFHLQFSAGRRISIGVVAAIDVLAAVVVIGVDGDVFVVLVASLAIGVSHVLFCIFCDV